MTANKLKFTKDEMYLIERTADESASIASRNIYHLTEKFLWFGGVEFEQKEKSDVTPEQRLMVRKAIMKGIQEHNRVLESWNAIRMKCEDARGGKKKDAKTNSAKKSNHD